MNINYLFLLTPENRTCKNCVAPGLSSQSIKGTDNVRDVEKSCSCHSKFGEWFPKGSSAVLTPETILVEESIEICECLTDVEAESQEEPGDQVTAFEPHESSVSAFREHTEHNDALASMFIDILADENNTQDNKDSGIITGENKTFEKRESGNPSQQNAKESTAQSQQPCDIFHTVSVFTKASQDDYNCSTVSKKSEQSEESFESGYQSSSINSASLDARDLQHMVHQGLFPCSSESHHDLCVLIQEPPNKPSFGTKRDRISNSVRKSFDPLASPSPGLCSSAYKSFDTLISLSMEPRGSAYKSCDTLMSPSTEPCGSAYRSFDTLVSASKELSSSAYKSFDSLMSQSMADNSLSTCVENIHSSPPLTESSESPELTCRGQIYPPPSNLAHYTNYKSPCAGLSFQNTCSEHPDFPSFSMAANDSASAFLPEEEIHKQLAYRNVQKKANMISCPIESQPSGYQPFDNAVECHGTYCDNDSEVISRSLCEPFFHLLYNNLRETPSDTIIHEPDQRTDDHLCLVAQGFDSSIVPDLASSANVTQTGDGSLRIISSSELSGDCEDENTSRDKQLLHLLELNCQHFNSRERTMKETKPTSFICAGEGLQDSSSDRLSAAFHCHTHSCCGKLGSAGEKKEVTPAVGTCGSAARSPEESLGSVGINLEGKTAEPQELLVSDVLSPPLFVDDPCPSDSDTVHREGSRLAPAVKERPVELLRENIRKNGRKMKLVQALAQEDNCYMKVA